MENADGLGRPLSRWLIARGVVVVDVPTTTTARVRELSRGGRRKNDRIDAAAAACVAALRGEGRPVVCDEHADALRMLEERETISRAIGLARSPASCGAGRTVWRRRADQPDCQRGRCDVARVSSAHGRGSVRVDLCKELITDIRRLDQQLNSNQRELDRLLDEHDTRLREIDGIGQVLAARLIGRTGPAARFPTAAAGATYNGTAPIEIASADRWRHRLSRYGDRQLNSAIHTIAMVQVRMPGSPGRVYYDRKIVTAATPRAAMRWLKRHLPTVFGEP
nr:IS110 family transposase [Nocardia abscessus]